MSATMDTQQCARLLKAIADPDRLRIIQCLRSGPKNVTEIAKILNAEIVNVSHHLGVLRMANIVQDRKSGRFVVYSMHPTIYSGEGKHDHLTLGPCRLEMPKA